MFEIGGNSWKENIVLSSVPLWKYNQLIPIANASGCLIDYRDCRFLLSIAHASIAESEWQFELNSLTKEQNGDWTVLYQPVKMNFLKEFSLLPETNDLSETKLVDFTYRRLDPNTISYHVIALEGNQPIGAYRTIFQPDFNIEPSIKKKYGFYGNVRFGGVEGNKIIFEHRLEHELRYIGKENGHYMFRLPHKYGSHANYQGCSGAPIIDEDNNLIALVSFGSKQTNCIYGIDIKKYLAALDIECQPS